MKMKFDNAKVTSYFDGAMNLVDEAEAVIVHEVYLDGRSTWSSVEQEAGGDASKAVRLDADTLRAARRPGVVYVEKYDPNEPRDDHGRWTDGGGSADGGSGESATSAPSIPAEHSARLPEPQRAVLERMYAQAAEAKPTFDATLKDIADQTGTELKLASLKGTDRATAKIVADYNGDASQVKDLLRATVIANGQQDVDQVVGQLREKFTVVREKNRFSNPGEDGYRDYMLNVKTANGHVAEVQVNVRGMLIAKKEVHPLYVQRETIRRIGATRALSPHEFMVVRTLNEQMRTVYDRAWAGAP